MIRLAAAILCLALRPVPAGSAEPAKRRILRRPAAARPPTPAPPPTRLKALPPASRSRTARPKASEPSPTTRPEAAPAPAELSWPAALELGLEPGDRVLHLGGSPPARLWAVVRRGLAVESLAGASEAPSSRVSRREEALTRREAALSEARRDRAERQGREPKLTARSFRLPEGERLWVRFPKGLPSYLRKGDIVEGGTAAAVATDAQLDFIALPHGSRVWAQVVEESEEGPVRAVRLHLYKIQAAGGGIYPLSAALTDASGDKTLLKVSGGGTLVGAPGETGLLAGPDRSFEARLLKPLVLYEPVEYYAAGPGLWLRSVGEGKARAFEVTHVIAGRAAAQAGIELGDRVTQIGSTRAAKLEYAEAIARLYGPPGSLIRLKVSRPDGQGARSVSLVRGAVFRKAFGFSHRKDAGGAVVSEVAPGSSADRAGLKAGWRILATEEGPGGEVVLSAADPKGRRRSLRLARDPYPVPLDVRSRLTGESLPVPAGR